MIHLYTNPGTRGTRATWALEEAGAEYELDIIDLMKGEGRSREYLGVNPGGKVPAIIVDGLYLSESGAICNWVGEHFPDSGLTPPGGSRERAIYDRWCYFVVSELEQPLWTMAKHRFALPEDFRVPEVIETAKWEFGNALSVIAAALRDRRHLVGERFTAADLLAAHTLAWARRYEMPLTDEQVTAYADEHLSRPAFARARRRERDAKEAKDARQAGEAK